MKLTYISACLDNSGYAEAARNNIAALDSVGIDVEVQPVSFEHFRSDLGRIGQKVQSLVTKEPKAEIQLIHTTPNVFPRFVSPNKYNIGYTTWETDKLPADWVDKINLMDEVWVPSTWNAEVFKNSGVIRPIFVFPHTFNRKLAEEETSALPLQNIAPDEFVFYSIFQWTERKNPSALLKAFLTEFRKDEKVCLVMKTYLVNPNNEIERERIKTAINEIKQKLYLKEYPKMLLITSLLSRKEIYQLHATGDCYLSFHRDEGFGIPVVEAMMAANPVICTGYGGTEDFIKAPNAFEPECPIQTGYPISYQLTPCYGMPWENYTGHMTWADIDIMEARERMRAVFEHRDKAAIVGQAGQKFVDDNYSWDKVGQSMKERLEVIERSWK